MASVGKVVNCTNSVNVRSGPGTDHAKIGVAPKDTIYTVTGKSGSWYQIDFNGRTGWIYAQYLSVSDVPSPPPDSLGIISVYYAGWSAYDGYTPQKIPAAGLSHIIYAFAVIGAGLKVEMGDAYIDPSNFDQLRQLKSRYPRLQTLIAVGGWEGSGRFSDAALTSASRNIFAQSAVAFMKRYGFDGVDIDWEFPTGGGLPTNSARPQDKSNFTLLMAALRQKLDAQGAVDGKHYLLTFAGASENFYADSAELAKLAAYADYAFLMGYDMHGSSGAYTDFNAPLYAPRESSPQFKWSCDDAVRLWQKSGVPAAKIVLGIPFYGISYSGVRNAGNGLYQRYSSCAPISYDQIAARYLSNKAYKRFVHPDARTPWLFNGSTFVSYEDAGSIAKKTAYIRQKGLGGAGAWEFSHDRSGALLSALCSTMK